METIYENVQEFIHIPYILIVIFGAWGLMKFQFVQRFYTSDSGEQRKDRRTLFVFIFALVVALPFWFTNIEWWRLLLSYCVATSLYDLLIKKLLEKIG